MGVKAFETVSAMATVCETESATDPMEVSASVTSLRTDSVVKVTSRTRSATQLVEQVTSSDQDRRPTRRRRRPSSDKIGDRLGGEGNLKDKIGDRLGGEGNLKDWIDRLGNDGEDGLRDKIGNRLGNDGDLRDRIGDRLGRNDGLRDRLGDRLERSRS